MYDPVYEARCEELARKGRKPSRRKRFKVVQLPDDPRIGRKASGTMKAADRGFIRGDRIGDTEPGTSERSIWLNVGRVIDQPTGKVSGKDIA